MQKEQTLISLHTTASDLGDTVDRVLGLALNIQWASNYGTGIVFIWNMKAIWKVVATVEFLKAKSKTTYILHITVKVYICSFKWWYIRLVLLSLYKVIAPCIDTLFV